MLNHVELHSPTCFPDESTLCTTERHHKLPEPVSLTLRDVYDPDVHKIIAAGHLFSLKKLRTLELHDTIDPHLLLAAISDTVKELVIHASSASRYGCSLLFHRVESILFSLDTKYTFRVILLWWTRVMAQNNSNNTVQRVTIEIQLNLEPGRPAPKIRFSDVWTEFGTALVGLVALKELVIIYQPGRGDRIRNTDDVATRAGVTKFLRGTLGAITDPAHVRLAFIDRNV
ncbi:hypothetical protein BDZ89DRAFT_504412 [Hymenopellis radicata]|nr:hypothetical protein BDZ89DRAFT_504412 [Hymenopellis radicata]